MMRLSVKQRVMLWVCVVLLLMAVLVYLVLQRSIVQQTEAFAAETLLRAASAAKAEIELEDGELELDDDLDDIDYANITVYESNGRVQLYGRVPQFDAPLLAGRVQQVLGDHASTWHVYDTQHVLDDTLWVWVRTSVRMDSGLSVTNRSKTVFLWMILPIALLGILGGYVITRRAFRPIAQMAETVQNIASGEDLSKRIGLTGRDEFAKLAGVVDAMLERLQSAFEQERRFTSDASHELRTPLAVIETQCSLALEGEDSQEQREALAVIQGQAQKLTRMVKELLTLARMDANTQKLVYEQVDLSALMEIVAEELRPVAQEKGMRVELDISPACSLLADEMLMMRMLINLVGNAIQFGRAQGFVRLSLRRESDWLVGSVADDGVGMTQEQLPHIWERFYQADASRSGENGSSGLGLSMVAWIVHAHGGAITVQSAPGEGSTFEFRLPIAQEARH